MAFQNTVTCSAVYAREWRQNEIQVREKINSHFARGLLGEGKLCTKKQLASLLSRQLGKKPKKTRDEDGVVLNCENDLLRQFQQQSEKRENLTGERIRAH